MISASDGNWLGALYSRGETHFLVWAPQARSVELVFEVPSRRVSLQRADQGYFAGGCC